MRFIRTMPIAMALILLLALAFSATSAAADDAAGVTAQSATGDVNCSGEINSIDAALLLQFEAALIDSLPCPDAADVNGDGVTNSLDAALLLQFDAGLTIGLTRMSLLVKEPAGLCDDPARPTTCDIPVGSQFDLTIAIENVSPQGYIAFQTELFIDQLTYHPMKLADDEVVWPDRGLGLRSPPGPGWAVVTHGGLTALTPTFPVSHYAGPLVEISLSCTEASSNLHLALLPYSDHDALGSSIVVEGAGPFDVRSIPTVGRADVDINLNGTIDSSEADRPVVASLEINCVADVP